VCLNLVTWKKSILWCTVRKTSNPFEYYTLICAYRFPTWIFLSDSPSKMLCVFLFFSMHAAYKYKVIARYPIIIVTFHVVYKLRKTSVWNFLQLPPIFFTFPPSSCRLAQMFSPHYLVLVTLRRMLGFDKHTDINTRQRMVFMLSLKHCRNSFCLIVPLVTLPFPVCPHNSDTNRYACLL